VNIILSVNDPKNAKKKGVIVKIKNYITGSILFFTMIACGVPSLSQSAVPPTFDPGKIPTIIALTANAAVTQIATVAPSPLLTETTTPDPSIINGTIERLSNGGTKYTDNEVGFEITYPKGWLTLRPNSDEFNSALKKEAVKNNILRKQMELDLADYEAGVDRLYSYPLLPDIEKNSAFGFSKLKWDVNDSVPIDDQTMGKAVRFVESSVSGFRADTVQTYENVNHVKLVEVGGQFSISNDQGDIIPFYMTYFLFKPTSGTSALITFTYLKDYKTKIASDVMSVANSIKLLDL
jgi:hypothetical protein